MAIILEGLSKCAICDGVITSMRSCVVTPAFVESKADPLWQFNDAPIHRECFANWNNRAEFVRAFNTFYATHYRGMRVMNSNGEVEDKRS
jgi:hypothetical protein